MPQSEYQSRKDGNGSQLRQRRSQIIKDKIEDTRVKRVIQNSVGRSQYSSHYLKTILVVITALLCTVAALLRYSNPKLVERLWKKKTPIPTFQLATRYRPNIVVERDLPRFFRHYTIATPENAMAREAVLKMLRSRDQLRRRAGRIKTSVKAWDDSHVEQLLTQRVCGEDFEAAYRRASQPRKDNLLMWCLIASRITEGFFKESLEFIDSPLFLTFADGYGALSTSFYLHPRINNSAEINMMPSKVLSLLISAPEEDGALGGEEAIERMIYELVVTEGNEKGFLILEEMCQDTRPDRAVAREIGQHGERCFFVVPKSYGGNFDQIEDE
eukprot:CAMPEP_0116153964 /NCGR_PEP_ID=MMETSP0329-20121206/21528_1 /TAXON_ID=697910 /ORGANISM="Pseudo-nitzschia arenysensis, Strain B593" /LENGTH=327 /DNA_ID=CAMNT_0003650913 /DNA_START=98 /DNA_END=1081 /DNA_ORIENTATION=+